MDLSIILTAHNEGILAHKTLLSLFRALDQIPEYSYEIVVHLDRASSDTREYFSRYKSDERFRILENEFGDLGLSRNFAINKAKGKYIYIIDSDDLLSENTLRVALNSISNDSNSLYHPEFVLSFGEVNELKVCRESSSRQEMAYKLLSKNLWPSSVFGRRGIFLETPYLPSRDGIGYEDWSFNVNTIEKNIKHKVLNECILFYRRKKNDSLLSVSNAKGVMQPYSSLFDISKLSKEKYISNKQKKNESSLIKIYRSARNNKKINSIITPIASMARRISGKKLIPSECKQYFSDDFINKWADIGNIENQAYPFSLLIDNMALYSDASDVSGCFSRLASSFTDYPDIVFIAPWVSVGGADKVLLNYISALNAIYDNINIAVITTVSHHNDQKDRLPKNVSLFEFGDCSERLNEAEKDLLFSRLITQLRCTRIHVINSLDAYAWIARHIDFVKKEIILTASYFCPSVFNKASFSISADYASPCLVSVYPAIRGIYTDNSVTIESAIRRNGFARDLCKIHYQPIGVRDFSPEKNHEKKSGKLIRILWAGRICSQKNPHLLVEIAKRLSSHYHIDVYGQFAEEINNKIFNRIPNLTYRGEFSGFSSIDISSYNMLLYTSKIDGMPNIILEAASSHLPIIASNVGGISDVVHDGTGILIDDYLNAEEYVDAIESLAHSPEKASKMANCALELISKQYSWDNFIKTVKEDFRFDIDK